MCYSNREMNEITQYHDFAVKLAYQAGEIMLKHFQIGIAKETKSDHTPLTIADTAINHMVIESVNKEYPDHVIQGEEESYKKSNSAYVWSCDPIDGTIPYTFGVPTSLFSLALLKDGEPILGVLYDPYMKRLYHAMKGEGAFLNETRIMVNSEKTFAHNYFGFPTYQATMVNQSALFDVFLKKQVKMLEYYSITYMASLVATGQWIGTLFQFDKPYDIAAVKVIVEEAGGKVTNMRGEEQRYDQPLFGAIISNGVIHEKLVKLVKKHLA